MKKIFIISFVTLLSICILVNTGIAQAKNKKPIKMKIVSMMFTDDPSTELLKMYIERVNQRSEGKLEISWIGGPEVINEFELGNSVATGIIDMAYVTSAFYSGNAPGVEFYFATQLSAEELRKNGFYDYFNELHHKGNLEFIGGGEEITDLWKIYLNKPVKQLSDLKGLRIGDGTVALGFLKTVGAAPVTIGAPDAYTALERGVIDGILYPNRLITAIKLQEVLKYYIDVPVYRHDVNYIMNLDRWKSLPEELQKIMKETALEMEKESAPLTQAIEDQALKDIVAAKLIKIQFTPAEAEKAKTLLYSTEWEQAIMRYPKIGPELKKYLSGPNN